MTRIIYPNRKKPMTEEQIEEIKKHYTPPFEYDKDNEVAMDRNERGIIDLQYANPCKDLLGQLIADLLNERLQPKQEGEG